MSVSTVLSTASTSSTDRRSEFRQDFQDLGKALSSGDLQGAQSAFSKLQSLRPNPSSSSSPSSSTSGSSPFDQLAQALQKGDLQGAQSAFQSMKSHGGHHHHHPSNDGDAQSTAATTGVGAGVNVSA